MTPVLRANNLQHSYATGQSKLEVLKGLDLLLFPAQVVAILGPSGSGKSTLLHLLAGLERPSGGDIFWAGQNINKLSQHQLTNIRAKALGLVFQQHYLLEDLSVLENVTLPGRIAHNVDLARGHELLARVGLSQRADYYPQKLSGGERQRVAVARALYARPQVILADEPTGSLDRYTAKTVYALLVELALEEQSAILMVTHDEGLVSEVDARFYLEEGQLVSA